VCAPTVEGEGQGVDTSAAATPEVCRLAAWLLLERKKELRAAIAAAYSLGWLVK
jgi:hypothetical protein